MTFLASLYDGKLGYAAQQDRGLISAILQPGVINANDCLVSAGTGLSSVIAAGSVVVPNTFLSARGGSYLCTNDGPISITHASGAFIPRIDSIYVRVYDSETGGDASDSTQAVLVPGTPSASANFTTLTGVGAAPPNSYLLAYVLVPTNVTESSRFLYKSMRATAPLTRGRSVEPAQGSFRAHRRSAQRIPSNVNTVLICETEDWDISSWYNASTGKFIPQVAAIYRISVGVKIIVEETRMTRVYLHKNEELYSLIDENIGSTINSSSDLVSFNGTTDEIYVQVYHNRATEAESGTGVTCYIAGEMVGLT